MPSYMYHDSTRNAPLCLFAASLPRLEWANGQYLHGTLGNFGPQTWTPISSVPIVLAQPDTGVAVPGMSSTAYTGKVVLVKRGGVAYTAKVKNAQDHGAAAVVVYNNVAGDVTMGGSGDAAVDASITIPSMLITKSRGETLRALTNGTVNVTMKLGGSLHARTPFAQSQNRTNNRAHAQVPCMCE